MKSTIYIVITKQFDIQKHLKEEHNISPFQTYLKEIVYGGNDGIVTTFAVVAGFTGAQLGNIGGPGFVTVLLFGLANLFADGLSMGLGNVLSLRADQDVYRSEEAKERYEVKNHPESEIAETIALLQQKGFTKKQASDLTTIYATNEDYWIDFMMKYELEMEDPRKTNPLFTGLATFIAFIIFGFIPLIPYLLTTQADLAFQQACFATLIALILLGLLRWKVTKENAIRSIIEIVTIGSLAALAAYFVGTFFKV